MDYLARAREICPKKVELKKMIFKYVYPGYDYCKPIDCRWSLAVNRVADTILDLCLPIIAELLKENAKLKEKLQVHKNATIDGDCQLCDYESFQAKLKAKDSEIAELKKRIEDLAHNKSKMSGYIRDMADDRKSKDSEIATLKERIAIMGELPDTIAGKMLEQRKEIARLRSLLEEIIPIITSVKDNPKSRVVSDGCIKALDIANRALEGGE